MGNGKQNKHGFRIRVLVLSVIVCAWLLSAGIGTAASASQTVKVSVSVVDAIGVDFGISALDTASRSGAGQVVTEFIDQTASSSLAARPDNHAESDIILTVTNL